MGPFRYKVMRINGDYAELLRIDIETEDILSVAMALLPEETDEEIELICENFAYSVAE